MRLVCDSESDNLAYDAKHVWTICCSDLDSDRKWAFRPHEIDDALNLLSSASLISFHNWTNHDGPLLERLKGWTPPPTCQVIDSLILSKLNHSDLANEDQKSKRKPVQDLLGSHSIKAWGVRLKLAKSAWGDEEGSWDQFSEEMLQRCVRDAEIGKLILQHLMSEGYSQEALDLEQRYAAITERMTRRGFTLDVQKTQDLYQEIKEAQERLGIELRRDVPGTTEEMKTPAYYRVIWPDGSIQDFPTKGAADTERKARKIKPKDYRVEAGPNRVKVHEFNPGSRQQVRRLLYDKYKWTAPVLTDAGFVAVIHERDPKSKKTLEKVADLKAYLKKHRGTPDPTDDEIQRFAVEHGKINEETLSECPYTEAKQIARYLTMGKRLGQIGDGDNAWLKLVEPDGRIRHRNDTIGCSTMRNAHYRPNLGQVPSVETGKDAEGNAIHLHGEAGGWGWECRDCFVAAEGYELVGSDLSGIEARMLAHFLYPFDRGKFMDKLLGGDIHQDNANAMAEVFGFDVGRSDVKSPFYAVCYGGGEVKLGRTMARDNANAKALFSRTVEEHKRRGMNESEAVREAFRDIGRKVRTGLERGIEGLGSLLEAVRTAAERGYLSPFDGRRIPVRSPHSALNALLQSTATICMKRWIVTTFEEVKRREWDCHLLAVVHDESQTEVRPHLTQEYAALTLEKIKESGVYYRLKCPLDGEVKIGSAWSETH